MQKHTDSYGSQSIEDTVRALHTNAGHGLDAAEVAKRLEQYGYNEIEEEEEPLWHRIFRRFWGPIPWMIEVAYANTVVQQGEMLTVVVNTGMHTNFSGVVALVASADGWFWERPWPSPLLFGATFSTEIVGTLIAVYGFMITPIGWEPALWIWAYALVWFLVNDAVKVFTYRILQREGVFA